MSAGKRGVPVDRYTADESGNHRHGDNKSGMPPKGSVMRTERGRIVRKARRNLRYRAYEELEENCGESDRNSHSRAQ